MQTARRKYHHGLVALTLVAVCLIGCATTLPPPAPSIADTDATFSTPMRSKVERKRNWFDFENLLDQRSRDIEGNLGF